MPDRAESDGPPAAGDTGSTCLFLAFPASALAGADGTPALERFESTASALAAAPGFAGLRAHVPSDADDPYLKDTDAPGLVLQVYFDSRDALAAQCERGSVLDGAMNEVMAAVVGAIASAGSGAAGADPKAEAEAVTGATWQAMSVERIDLASAGPLPPVHCTYLVAYEGTTPDAAAWHGHYQEHHVPLMKRLPGLRQLELYRPLTGAFEVPVPVPASALAAFRPAQAMQRNKVVFDSPQALTSALNSPIRHEMRKDYLQSPPFDGRATHYPMATRSWP